MWITWVAKALILQLCFSSTEYSSSLQLLRFVLGHAHCTLPFLAVNVLVLPLLLPFASHLFVATDVLPAILLLNFGSVSLLFALHTCVWRSESEWEKEREREWEGESWFVVKSNFNVLIRVCQGLTGKAQMGSGGGGARGQVSYQLKAAAKWKTSCNKLQQQQLNKHAPFSINNFFYFAELYNTGKCNSSPNTTLATTNTLLLRLTKRAALPNWFATGKPTVA